ncbi:MAG: RES family NAD+ phosphorylase [Flavobacteriales bacterium]|nr:RES family NAD+ phosphorylase [Flavobacteriales bacterium]
MEIYRITLARYSESLSASGRAARWNSKGRQVVYAAQSRSLACLENLVHRSGLALQQDFRTVVIKVPDAGHVKVLSDGELPDNWKSFMNLASCQSLGDDWLSKQESLLLRVPSVIIPQEFNYLLNPQHPDFERALIEAVEPFLFDPPNDGHKPMKRT